ncbi:uncharacterized protein LOC127781191 isoform X1 [Oryza glaberrima]|uniref:uncharacterized protein LOC127781191 isoform X1 n=1 Tax=Oryza glaberrima TaxID=4538 RepID=UPI00224C1932|nr:uncharacterized protein LOC127781191 isoform X1 [Oryza glaberrima]
MNNKEHKSRRNKDIPEMRSEKVATPKVSIKRKRKCEFEFLDDEVATTKYLMNEFLARSVEIYFELASQLEELKQEQDSLISTRAPSLEMGMAFQRAEKLPSLIVEKETKMAIESIVFKQMEQNRELSSPHKRPKGGVYLSVPEIPSNPQHPAFHALTNMKANLSSRPVGTRGWPPVWQHGDDWCSRAYIAGGGSCFSGMYAVHMRHFLQFYNNMGRRLFLSGEYIFPSVWVNLLYRCCIGGGAQMSIFLRACSVNPLPMNWDIERRIILCIVYLQSLIIMIGDNNGHKKTYN